MLKFTENASKQKKVDVAKVKKSNNNLKAEMTYFKKKNIYDEKKGIILFCKIYSQ